MKTVNLPTKLLTLEGVKLPKAKKGVDEAVNKTARKNQTKGKAQNKDFIPSPDCPRIISLNGGQHAYILNPTNGRTHHLKVDSDEYRSLVETLGL